MTAMISYRTAAEFQTRFGRERREDGRFQVQSYLDHHGEKLLRRFDLESYRALIDTMDRHDVGRGRGGVAAALGAFRGRLIGVGIPGDLLYGEADVRGWTEAAGAEYRELHSPYGHDAFLIETTAVAGLLGEALGDEGEAGRGEGDVVVGGSGAEELRTGQYSSAPDLVRGGQ
jgi:homoserine O-acetyltransferase